MQINSVTYANRLKSLAKKLMCSLLKVNLSNKRSCRAIKTLSFARNEGQGKKNKLFDKFACNVRSMLRYHGTYRQSVWSAQYNKVYCDVEGLPNMRGKCAQKPKETQLQY